MKKSPANSLRPNPQGKVAAAPGASKTAFNEEKDDLISSLGNRGKGGKGKTAPMKRKQPKNVKPAGKNSRSRPSTY